MRIFISTGEPSGDLHAANLIESIRRIQPEAEFVGYGGPRMREAGATVLYPLVELAVMWFGRVLLNLHKFIGLLGRADRFFRDERPDAVVLIDYPGFNWHIARRARRRGIPVFYYVPPQLWAWAGWRVKKVRRYVDLVLCSLPFEPAWYRDRGVPGAVHVGHPYFDELAERTLDEDFVVSERAKGGPVVAILPGSRTQELTKNLPIMLRAAALLVEGRPDVRFVVACLHERHRALARELIAESGAALPIEVHAARTPELIRLADVAWAVSGSVGLELMAEALPTVVLYKVNRFDLWIARPFIKARFISLVNLLADAEVMPEYLTSRDVSPEMASWARAWLDDPEARARASAALAALRARVAVPGASDRAATRIVEALGATAPSRPPAPHFATRPRLGDEAGSSGWGAG
jgi:lipid-A-disaccharide synthase